MPNRAPATSRNWTFWDRTGIALPRLAAREVGCAQRPRHSFAGVAEHPACSWGLYIGTTGALLRPLVNGQTDGPNGRRN
jgi:hypothetical protein